MPAASSPTVLLAVHQGFAARYLLRNGLLQGLRERGARIVVLTPNAEEPYLQEELGPDVVIEPLRARGFEVAQGSRSWWLALHLRMYSLGDGRRSAALMSKYRGFLRRLRLDSPVIAALFDVLVRPFRRSRRLRLGLLAFEQRRHSPDVHGDVFARHRPDLVLTSSPGWFLPDAVVLREARRHGVRSVAVVAGWDNPTSKGYRGADPDLVVAWSDRMADQLVRHHDLPRDRILVAGNPHFDRYVRPGATLSREELDAALGLAPDRKVVVFATSTPGAWDGNLELAEALGEATEPGGPLEDAQVVVRLHPIFLRPDHSPPLEALNAVRERHPHVHLDIPEVRSDLLRCDLAETDNLRFSSILAAADALLCVFSTTTLEAFLADVPVILAAPTAHLDRAVEADDAPRWSQYEHLSEVVASGAAEVATHRAEVIDLIRRALDDRVAGRAARRSVAEIECGPTDGRSGERLAGRLLDWAAGGHLDRRSDPRTDRPLTPA